MAVTDPIPKKKRNQRAIIILTHHADKQDKIQLTVQFEPSIKETIPNQLSGGSETRVKPECVNNPAVLIASRAQEWIMKNIVALAAPVPTEDDRKIIVPNRFAGGGPSHGG